MLQHDKILTYDFNSISVNWLSYNDFDGSITTFVFNILVLSISSSKVMIYFLHCCWGVGKDSKESTYLLI